MKKKTFCTHQFVTTQNVMIETGIKVDYQKCKKCGKGRVK